MDKSTLGDRMKNYERVSSPNLMRKTPVIIRLDGKAFHSYTRQSFIKDEGTFSELMSQAFALATERVLPEIQGARFAYMQSDEVSILISDWKKVTSDAWFKYGTQKMASVAASMFTVFFNNWVTTLVGSVSPPVKPVPAFFDARVFNLPPHEVVNYFIWRQQDATRNSINMLARTYFSHKQLHGVNTSGVQDMLIDEHNVNWNDLQTRFKRGQAVVSEVHEDHCYFKIDRDIPIFTQDRDFINQYISDLSV